MRFKVQRSEFAFQPFRHHAFATPNPTLTPVRHFQIFMVSRVGICFDKQCC